MRKSKPGSNCQAINIPMKWAFFVISLFHLITVLVEGNGNGFV